MTIQSSVPVETVNKELSVFLKKMSPTEPGLKLYISHLMKTYHQKMLKLNRRKGIADEEISKLNALRQVLIEKNLAGVYSDEIFKEQNASIENRIISSQASKSDALIDQYNIEAITEFLNTKLANLDQTYVTSTLSQLRCLLGSIFLSGIVWAYPGCSNRDISPLYQSILNSDKHDVAFGEPHGILHRLREFSQEFLTMSSLPDFVWLLQPELASKMPEITK